MSTTPLTLRAEGHAATDAADVHPAREFAPYYDAAIEHLAGEGNPFTADCVTAYAESLARSDGREFTPSPALIGSRFGHARKAGLITRTDWAPSQRKTRHGSENRVWVGTTP